MAEVATTSRDIKAKMADPEAPRVDLLSMYSNAMTKFLDSLPTPDLAAVQAFADQEDTPKGLSLLALAHLQETEDLKKQAREEEEEEEDMLGRKRALTSVEARGARRGGTLAINITHSLLKLGERMDTDYEDARSGFKRGEEIYSFEISVWQALIQTVKNVLAMLLISLALSFISISLIYGFRGFLKGTTIEDAANLQFGADSTNEDYEREDFDDIYSEERDRRTKQFLSISCAFSWAMMNAFALFSIEKNVPYVYYSVFFLIMAIPGFLPTVFYACGGTNLGSGIFVAIVCFFSGMTNAVIPDLIGVKGIDALIPAAVEAARNKVATENGDMAKVKTRKTKMQRLKIAVFTCLPTLFICVMIVVYTALIFALYNVYDSNIWKAAISVFALLIKVTGNKGEIKLIELTGQTHVWVNDLVLFGYEFATALLCRLLQLSIPSQQIAQLMSLFGCILEMGVRVFFFNNYLKDGLRKQGKWTTEERDAYRKRGMLRAQDGNNDMVVEYVSCAAAVAILIFAVPTGALTLDAGQAVDPTQIMSIVLFQVGPEIILDFYCVFMEIYGGLGVFHSKYWSFSAGSKTTNGRWKFFGNLAKGFVVKLFTMVALFNLIVLSIAK